jgi:hypothetical protein
VLAAILYPLVLLALRHTALGQNRPSLQLEPVMKFPPPGHAGA